MFYSSSFRGNNLYWMSKPYKGEYGDWIGCPLLPNERYRIQGSGSLITSGHHKDFNEILKNMEVQMANIRNDGVMYNLTNGLAQHDLFKKIAIQNIKSHSEKFTNSYISNVRRMIFNFPASCVLQKPGTIPRLPINGILTVVSISGVFPALMNWGKVIFSQKFFFNLCTTLFSGECFEKCRSHNICFHGNFSIRN